MHRFLVSLLFLLVADYSLVLSGNSIIETPSITITSGEKLVVRIDQSGWIFVEILLNGKQIFNNTAQGNYVNVNITLEEPGDYTISMRNTRYSSERITYSIMITGKSYSRSIVLS